MKKFGGFILILSLVGCNGDEKYCEDLSSQLQGAEFIGEAWFCDSSGTMILDTLRVTFAGYNSSGGYMSVYHDSVRIDSSYSVNFSCNEDVKENEHVMLENETNTSQFGLYDGSLKKLTLNIKFPGCSSEIQFTGYTIP